MLIMKFPYRCLALDGVDLDLFKKLKAPFINITFTFCFNRLNPQYNVH